MNGRFVIVDLGSQIKQISRRNSANADIEVFSVTNSEGFAKSTDYFSKEVFSKNVSNYKVVNPNEFAYNPSRINVGSIDYLKYNEPALVSPLYITFSCKNNLHPGFLLRYLKSRQGNVQIRANTEGAVRDSLKFSGLERIKLPLPPLSEQARIVHLLGKVEGLIAQRKQQLVQLDALLRSVFLEMFGDPVRNEKGWEKVQFSKLLDRIESGTSPKCEAREATTDEWGVLKLGAVTSCTFDATKNKALPHGVSPSVHHEVAAGDLLFTRKNTHELVAACAYVRETRPRLLMPDLIFRLVFKDTAKVNRIFIWKLLTNNSQRKAIQSLATGAAGSMPNISKANLKAVRLPMPPLPLQDQFAAIVEKIESTTALYRATLTDLETLYAALGQSAFKGELDLSRVPLSAATPASEPMQEGATASADLTVTRRPHLPDPGVPAAELADEKTRLRVLTGWLEAWQGHLGEQPFVVNDFLAAAQARLAGLYPEADGLDLGMAAYEHIKRWVHAALAAGTLAQPLDG